MRRAYIATKLGRAADHAELKAELAKFGIAISYNWTTHGSVKHCGQ